MPGLPGRGAQRGQEAQLARASEDMNRGLAHMLRSEAIRLRTRRQSLIAEIRSIDAELARMGEHVDGPVLVEDFYQLNPGAPRPEVS